MTDSLVRTAPASVALIEGDGGSPAQLDTGHLRTAIERSGAVLLRGFATTIDCFAALGEALCQTSVANESPNRETFDQHASVQSVNLGNQSFPLHPELAREPWRPDLAMFGCFVPPSAGGQTNVCDGIAIVENLPDDLRRTLAERELAYIRPASPELLRFWLNTDTPSDKILAHPPEACPYWFRRAQDRVIRGFNRPVFEPALFDERPAFGNFLLFARDLLRLRHVPMLDDGTEFPDEWLDIIRSTARKLTYAHKWQAGDVLLLDNSRFMHGRRAIGDTAARQIATYFGYLKGIERRPWDPPKPIWRQHMFRPPEAPPEN
jgi:hypothetical protein